MKVFLNVRLLILSAFLIFAGCTRLEREVSKFSISLPAVSSMAVTGVLSKVIINVRGSGIQVPISVNFEADKNGSTNSSLPSSFPIEVPSGSARLIQVLAIYVDGSTKNAEFYYGDTTIDLTGGDINVTIPLALAGSGNINGGLISGRYFSATGNTPTGVIESRYQPPAAKPAMVIQRSSMVHGWFSAFALDTIALDIVLAPQEEKLFGAFTLNSLTYSDQKKMKVKIPAAYQSYGGGSGESRNSEAAVIGFFGPGVPANSRVCFTQATYTFTNLFTDVTKTTAIQWNSASSNPANVIAEKDASVVTCTGADLLLSFVTVLPFDPSLMNNWGGSEAISGFMGVFRFPTNTANGSSPVSVSYSNAGTYTAKFSVLPGIPTFADSIAVYYRSYNSPRDYQNSREVPCQSISQGGFGFRPLGGIPLNVGTQDYTVTNTSPGDISSNSAFAFCPMKNGVILGGGFINDHVWNSFGGGGGTVANSFMASAFNKIGVNQCHRIHINLVDSSNNSWNVTNDNARSFSLTNTQGSAFFATEADCLAATPTIGTFTIPASNTNGEVWIKGANSPSTVESVTLSTTSFGSAIDRTIDINLETPGGATSTKAMPDNIYLGTNDCRVIELYMFNGVGIPSTVGGVTTVNLDKWDLLNNPVSDTTFDYYSDCASNAVITSISIPGGEFKGRFAVKSTGTPSSDRIIHTAGMGAANVFMNVTPLAHHLAVNLNNGQDVYVGSCVPVHIRAEDVSNNLLSGATFQFNTNVYHPTIPGPYGEFVYSDCTSSATGPYTLATGSYSLNFIPTISQAGVNFEAWSIFQQINQPKVVNILDVPPFTRSSSLKVHLTSDVLAPNEFSMTNWASPYNTGITFYPVTSSSVAVGGPVPKTDGAIFPNTSAFFSGSIATGISDEFAITVRFKLSSLIASDILALTNGTSPEDFKISTYFDGTNYKIIGSGGWTYTTPMTADTWYTVTLTRSGSNVFGYVNGVAAGSASGFTSPGTGYTGYRIGSGFSGAVKAVIIDASPSGPAAIGSADHSYLLQRVP